MNEVFEALEVDPKRALKIIQKEIDQRQKKIEPSIMGALRCVRGTVLDRCNRIEEARQEIFGVLDQISSSETFDQYLLDTVQRTSRSMQESQIFAQRYLEVVEALQAKNPNEKDLTFMLYEGSLQNNKF